MNEIYSINSTLKEINLKSLDEKISLIEKSKRIKRIIFDKRFFVDWGKFFQGYLVKTTDRLYSNYSFGKYSVSNPEGKDYNFYLFYIPPDYINIFENKIRKYAEKYYMINEPRNSPQTSLEFLQEESDHDLFISKEVSAHMYLNKDGPVMEYSINLDSCLNNSYENLNVKWDKNSYFFKLFSLVDNTKQINIKYLQNNYLKNYKLGQYLRDELNIKLSIDLKEFEHVFLEFESQYIDYLEMIANLPFPYKRVFYSHSKKTLFMEIALLGKYKTNIDLLSNDNKFKYYSIMKKDYFFKVPRIIDMKNKKFKNIRIKKASYF